MKIMKTYFVFLTKTGSKTDPQAKKFWSWIVEKTILEIVNQQHLKKIIWPMIFAICPYLKTPLLSLMDEKNHGVMPTYVRWLKVA